MRNIIFSIRRSGNHFLQETLAENYNTHYQKDHNFREDAVPYKMGIYLLRDIRDVLVSNYFWWKESGESWSLSVKKRFRKVSMHDFIRGIGLEPKSVRPEFEDRSIKSYFKDPVDYWAKHLYSFMGSLPIVKFEDLKQYPESTIRKVGSQLGFDIPEKIKEIKQLVGYNARKGIVGDWRNHFSEDDNQFIKGKVGLVMREFGYV